MDETAAFIAIAASALFAGGALYVSLVEQPGRMEAGVRIALAEFGPSYRRAAPWQGGNALVALAAGIAAAAVRAELLWAIGGIATGLVVPWTLVVMMPLNHRLLEPHDLDEERGEALLRRWARLHWIRSLLGGAGLVTTLVALLA